MAQENQAKQPSKGEDGFSPPAITLPKGGGAIRGIGEKFAANPVTGTGSMSVPIATSPGRSGFGPQLSLSYDSGSGNGPFGFGWNLSLPSITRKTDKGLPKYHDAEASDVFILSGAEDLVPVLKKQGTDWAPEDVPDRTIGTDTYQIQRYRPRIEGLFARIERWTNIQSNETHWRSISRDNITTVYGRTTDSKIEDPDALDGFPRVFSWLICESYDDKGNAIYYEYEPEDSAGIDLSQTNERNRTDKSRSANRYLKRIKYGNKTPVEHDSDLPREFREDLSERTDWLFEVVFDYEEGHYEELPADPNAHQFVNARIDPTQDWQRRQDPFSSFRSGFEVRTYRLCHRVLMFHHFKDELGVDDYLVRSTGFKYKEGPIASFITSVTQSGYKRQDDGAYLKKSLPPLEFEYSKATIQDKVEDVDEESIENLPQGLDGAQYKWVDIDGEGASGILTEQGDSWFYKRNVSALPVIDKDGKPHTVARFAPAERLAKIPSFTNLSEGRQQLLDLAGDGQLDVVEFDSPTPGFYERTKDEAWHPFKPFVSLPNIPWQDPNLKFVDLTGDGHADIFITEDEAFTWYPSLAETGFASGERVRQALDEEKGPKLVFADGTQSIYLADISGDGLTDLVRIRNGDVCYWPNLGYGRFAAKVTMDNSPLFDAPDQFDQRRIRLADIDGSGVTDIIYLKGDGVYIYLNESGNRWADAEKLKSFPRIDNLSSVMAVDLLGNGTACLVWSSSLPGDARAPMRYIDLMGGQKPHLLVKTMNNLGAETHIHYAPSTKFYLADKAARKPWITRLPFPVHVVERVETYDWISRNRFVTRYAYHHGYFDGVEREFRGFGMVEQWDTEEFAALNANDEFPKATNFDTASHVPPVLSKTWFHTGVYLGRNHVSDFFAGLLNGRDVGEYYREPELDDAQARQLLLEDTILPAGLTIEEEREACRALKGSMLREEVFALDGTDKEPHPFTVTEQNFTIEYLQPEADNRYAVFYVHPCEVINFHYERNPADPRISHALTLQVDKYGNVLKSLSIGYGRRQGLGPLQGHDKDKQEQTMFTCTEHDVTNAVDALDDYRTPLPAETRTYELTGLTLAADAVRFTFNDFAASNFEIFRSLTLIPYEQSMDYSAGQKRLIEQVRTRYRSNNLQGSNDGLLPIGVLQSLALPGETYKLAFTPGLLAQVYERNGQALLLDPASVLDGAGVDKGGYVDLDGDGHWWMPTGRIYYYDDAPAYELNEAHTHFFMPRHFIDPFGQDNKVSYDNFDLLVQETCDALDNRVTVGERDIDPNQPLVREGHNYRVLQPQLIMDPNRNCSEVAFDALCMVVGTAVMGKPEDNPRRGDLIDDNFNPDLTEALIVQHMQAPLADPHSILQRATMRIVYDVFAYHRTKAQVTPDPAVTCTLVRETHDADLDQSQETNVLHSLSYSDGFGQEIQKKIQAEPGPVPKRDQDDRIVIVDGRPEMTSNNHSPRWVGTGWTVFNNKNKPVRRYEPFFTDKHQFEFEIRIGVSPVLFYDPAERMVATLHPNHSWEKIVFDPWCQQIWDVNDTVLIDDPKTDADIGKFFERLSDDEYLPTWYTKRQSGAMGQQEQDAAIKTAVHANTPILAHFDALGRTFLTITHNKFKRSTDSGNDPPTEEFYESRLDLDIEGNQREVIDAKNRTVMRYDYDMLKNRIHQANMEAGERWMLNDTGGNAIRSWDNRGHNFRTEYDTHRRPLNNWVHGTDVDNSDPRTLNHDVLFEKTEYGENRANAMKLNLRTRVFKQYDDAGYVTNEAFDFKGNLLQTSRTLAEHYENISDWSSSVATDGVYLNRTTYDALNRSVTLTAPDNSVIRTTYNEANLLNTIEANLRGEQENNQPKWTPFVTNIDYDAKGQRTLIQYSNGTETRYRYDPDTFRLIHLYTRRGALYTEDCGDEPPPPRYAAPEDPPSNQTCGLQNLHYVYDPAGNITYVRDAAQQTIYFRNRRVEPSNEYTYDATYRLIEATGREHLGQNGPAPLSYNDHLCVGQLHPSDGNAMGRYRQQYVYDAVGNFLEMIHRGTDPAHAGWTRTYTYDEPSLVEPGKRSNRLTSTAIGQITETYSTNGDGYDPHGNMLKMPQLQVVQWDFEDQLRMTQRQAINAQDDEGQQRQGERTYYVYDATGERVRKVTKLTTGQLKDERIYFGRFEICRRHNGTPLVRETLHITDDKQRIALIETKTEVNGQPVQNLQPFQRYQFSNYLGCAVLELNQAAEIISYEEYYPYGSTSYQGINAEISAAAKRYRYSGKERDEESGLYYYGVRYYAVNFGRWCSADPGGILDDLNLYIFAKNNPINLYEKEGMQSESPASLHKVKLIREEFTFKESGEVEIKSKVKVMLHDVGSVRKGIEDASGLTCFYDAKAGVRQYYKKHKDIFYGEEEQAEEYGFIGRLPLSGSARKYRVITYNPEKKPLEYKKKVDVSKLYQEEVFQFAAMSINEGKPLIAGVNLPGYTEEGRSGKIINEGITDHFVVIMGYQAEVLNKNGTESAVITHLYAVDNHTGKRGLLTFAAEHRGRRAVSVGGVAGFSRPQITHLRPWPSQVSALEQGQWASYRNVFGVETRKKFLKKYRKKGTVTGIKIDVFTFYDQ